MRMLKFDGLSKALDKEKSLNFGYTTTTGCSGTDIKSNMIWKYYIEIWEPIFYNILTIFVFLNPIRGHSNIT